MTGTNPRLPIHAAHGSALTARSWQTEAPLRMLMNNLDPENAENPADLVVYGGTGKAARSWEAYDALVRTLSTLDLMSAVRRIRVPLWFVNGQFDQLRSHELLFRRLAPHAEFIVVPRTSHLVTAMRPRVFNAVLKLALAVVREQS